MLISLLIAPLLALRAMAAPNPDLMDLWPTRLVPTGTEPTTMTYTFAFPFPTTVTRVWNAGVVAAPTPTGGVTSGTALAANAAAATGGGGLPFNPLDPNAMSGILAAAFRQQADALLAEVKKQTITIVCAILFGTLGGLALIAGLVWCCRRRRKNKRARRAPAHVRLDSASDVAVEKGPRTAV